MKTIESPSLCHVVPFREAAEIRLEIIPPQRGRVGLYRGPAPADMVLVSGFALDLPGLRELRDGLTLMIRQLEDDGVDA